MSGVYFQFPHPGPDELTSPDSNHLPQSPPKTSATATTSISPAVPRELNTPQKLALRVRRAASKLDTGVGGGALGSDFVPHTSAPLDFSFYSIGSFKDHDLGWDYEPREHIKKITKTADGHYESTALKFSNNLVQEWSGFDSLVSLLLTKPAELSWIDISFNYIMNVDEVLLQFPNIKILYLHGNAIEKLSEVDKLAKLKNLRNITLHGNPVEDEDGYRQYVLARLPQLRTLDFTGVTKSDRQMAPKLVARNGYGSKQQDTKKKHRTQTY